MYSQISSTSLFCRNSVLYRITLVNLCSVQIQKMKKNILLYCFIFLLSITSKVNAEQPIETILAKAMKAAENYSEAVEEYDAEIYMRIYVETIKKNYLYRYTHFIPKFVLHDRNSNEGLIEVLGDLKFQYPNNYTADITHLFSTFSQKKVLDMLPSNLLHINVYNEMSSNERFFMPLREASKKYYTYKLERTYTNDNITYYTISFTPIYKAPKLLEGRFVLENGSWRVTQLKCEGVDLALDFSIELNMGEEESTKLLPVDATIYQKFSYLGNVVTNRNIVSIDYRTITLNDKRPKTKNLNISNFYKVRLDSVPLKNDSVFWENERKIPLQARERDIVDQFYLEQSKTNSEKLKNDSLYSNRVNPLLWAKNMVTNTRYKYKSTDIDYSGAFNPALLSYSSFDGFSYGQKLNINYEFKRQSTLQAKAFIGYLFKRKELFTNISTTWNYNPSHLGKLTLSIGNGNRTYSSMFLEEIQDSLINSG